MSTVFISCNNQETLKPHLEEGKVTHFDPNFESLSKHTAAPEWFADVKLGMCFHCGSYSVPAYGSSWYPHNMYKDNNGVRRYHEKTYGSIHEFGYEDFIPMFKAIKMREKHQITKIILHKWKRILKLQNK